MWPWLQRVLYYLDTRLGGCCVQAKRAELDAQLDELTGALVQQSQLDEASK